MLEKEKVLIEKLKSIYSFNISDDFLRKSMCKENDALFMMERCLESNISILPATIEVLKDANSMVSANSVIRMVRAALGDKENKQNLTQQDYLDLATTSASVSFSGVPLVNKSRIEQLKIVSLIDDKDKKRKTSLFLYGEILKFVSNPSIQQKIARHWSKLGDIQEIEDLVPSLFKNKPKTLLESQQIHILEIECSQIGAGIERKNKQELVIDLMEQCLTSFKSMEKEHSVIWANISKEKNTITVYLGDKSKAEKLELLVIESSNNITKWVELTNNDHIIFLHEIYPKLILKNILEEELPASKNNIKKLKI